MIKQHRVIVLEEFTKLREAIINNHLAAGQKASGKTIESLKIEQNGDKVILYGRQAFGTLETGRKAGAVPGNFREILYQWSIDKKISFDKDYKRKSFAYLLAKKIECEGTKLYREGGHNDIYSQLIPDTVEAIANRIGILFETEIDHIKIN